MRAYHHTYGLPVLTTNCSNNYGPYQFPEKLIPLMIVNALAGQPLPVYGDGQQIRDWLYVTDHAICDLLDELRPRADGGRYSEQITYVADRPGHDRRYAIDAGKIGQEIGWRPRETFATGIRKTVQWYLDHQGWVSNVQSGAYREWVEKNYGGRVE